MSDDELVKTAVAILNSINVNLDSSDVETIHRISRSKDGKPKKTIICIVNQKFYKKALFNWKKLSSVAINDNEIQLKNKVYINENHLLQENSILLQKIKEHITIWKMLLQRWSGTKDEWRDKAINVFHMNQLLELFPDFIFSDNRNSTGDAVFHAPLVKKLMERLQKYFFFFFFFVILIFI